MTEEVREGAPGQFIKLTDGITHYNEIGPANGELVLLIHGGGVTGMEVWRNNALFMADQGFKVLSYDMYGKGYSDRIEGEYTPELLSRQINELLAHLNYTDSITIISMSMGSIVALEYAAQHTQIVKRLVLIDPAATGDYKANVLLKLPVIADLLMTFYWYPKAVENQRKEFVNQQLFNEYSVRLRYFMEFKGYKKMNQSTWMHTLNQSKVSLLSKVAPKRVLLLYGKKDPYFPISSIAHYKRAYPSLLTVEIEEAGHMPHFEKPEEVNSILKDFLVLPLH